MPRKSYSEEFKRDAVAMYEDTDGVSCNSVAHDLGVNRGSLAAWVKRYGTGKKARAIDAAARARKASDSERIRQLEKHNRLLQQQRDILRTAAQYFAKEMGL
ncbi:IS3 family transposase [Corynebacterium timonense]|uniref:Transposase n=1 Tax=Corynebacterium timonense TaxID=441500 RepID=A0A1H1RLH4_9CORY|nr:IS3 family transposase [Corynebacterium timonense]SDS36548.1 transposase [Corynebacterium timonense]